MGGWVKEDAPLALVQVRYGDGVAAFQRDKQAV